ncbi:MAG TPA: hypothetical protein ENI23_14615 [bacterium]|nr:hypothetical protein [bacterium]
MSLYADEYFEEYWKKRLYRHPEENNKEAKKKARVFFYAGFNTGVFRARREMLKETEETS